MSGAHDNPFERFPRLYDWEHDSFEDDLALYQALVRRFGGPVLELACGTGRVLAALAAQGHSCTGVDSSPAMLARARQRMAEHDVAYALIEQPMQALDLEGRFRTILVPLDGLGLLLERGDQLAMLRAARAQATHDARLVLDLTNGNLRGGHESPEEVLHHLTAPDAATGLPITKWVVRRPDPAEQVDELQFLYDETDAVSGLLRRTHVNLRLRWFSRQEVELLLTLAGWRMAEVYGDYHLSPYGASSDRLIVVGTSS